MAHIIYMLSNQIVSIFISLQFATVIEFPSPVTTYVYGGSETDLIIDLIQNNKILSIKPRSGNINSNLVVTTKTGKYYFYLKTENARPHKFISIKDGLIESALVMVKDESTYAILEGATSAKVITKKGPIDVNGEQATTDLYFSKGAPLFINGARVFN